MNKYKTWLLKALTALSSVLGFIKVELECPDCGKIIPNSKASMDWHTRNCPADLEKHNA